MDVKTPSTGRHREPVTAVVTPADPQHPLRVTASVGGCGGGGSRILLTGHGVAHTGAGQPEALHVQALDDHDRPVTVVVLKGDRGIVAWPRGGHTETPVECEAVRLNSDRIIN